MHFLISLETVILLLNFLDDEELYKILITTTKSSCSAF